MRIVTSALVIASLSFACGKKAEPAPAADVAAPKPEAPKPEAPKPEAPKPEAPKPEAPVPEAPKPEAAVPEAPKPEAAALPGLWAPMFEEGRESRWVIAETVVASELDDSGALGKSTTKELAGKLTCKVDSVRSEQGKAPGGTEPEAIRLATISCTGYTFDYGVEDGPMGTWGTNGKVLWKRIGDTDEPRLDAEPQPKSMKDEETEVDVSKKDDGTWCWRLGIIIGDGGVLEACFDPTKGPVRFFGHGGSASVDSKLTVTLAP